MSRVLARRKSLLLFDPPAAADTIATGPDPVSEIRAFQMGSPGPGNGQVILQVRTQSGLVGYGECNSLTPSELKATSQVVVGRAPSAYEALNTLAPSAVRGGLNIALLDILGHLCRCERAVVRLKGVLRIACLEPKLANLVQCLCCTARIVCGAANNQLGPHGVEKLLADRGVIYAPDYVVNAGGVIQVADELGGFSFDRARAATEQIFTTTAKILSIADSDGVPPSVAADRLAERRMSDVGRLRGIWVGTMGSP